MSWNSNFIAINRDYSNQIDKLREDLGLVLGEPQRTVSWEEAMSSMATGKSIGIGNGWTIIFDPYMFLDTGEVESHDPDKIWLPTIEKGLENCSAGGKGLGFIMSGVSDTYGMTIYENGKLSRCRLVQQGNTIIDFGESLPEEIETFNEEFDEEERVFILLEKFGLPFDKLENIEFTLYESAVA